MEQNVLKFQSEFQKKPLIVSFSLNSKGILSTKTFTIVREFIQNETFEHFGGISSFSFWDF